MTTTNNNKDHKKKEKRKIRCGCAHHTDMFLVPFDYDDDKKEEK